LSAAQSLNLNLKRLQALEQAGAIALELGVAHAGDLAKLLEATGSPPHHLHQGAVVEHHIGRDALLAGLLTAPILEVL
jgi:hypothetical protein